MKKALLAFLFLCSSVSTFSATEIARITEKGSLRSLVYLQDETRMIFEYEVGGVTRSLNTLDIDSTSHSLSIRGDRNAYQFDFLSHMREASRDAYSWCWSPMNNFDPQIAPAFVGISFMLAPVVVSMSLCSVVPAVPFIVGLIVAPVDGMITLGDKMFDAENIAAKKFKKMMSGKSSKASSKVFNHLLKEIESL